MLRVDFDMSALDAQLDRLQANVAQAIRPAAQAAAQVLYEEVRLNAPRSEKAHFTKGKKQQFNPGNLQAAIYQVFSERASVPGKVATYEISWNEQKAFYGRFVEYGTSKMPAHSFLRRASESRVADALRAADAEFTQRMQQVTK